MAKNPLNKYEFDGENVIAEFEKRFGIKREDMTAAQILWLVALGKKVRYSCKSNAALHNWLNRSFPQFRFTTVKDTFTKRDKSVVPWDRLVITPKTPKKDVPVEEQVATETADED